MVKFSQPKRSLQELIGLQCPLNLLTTIKHIVILMKCPTLALSSVGVPERGMDAVLMAREQLKDQIVKVVLKVKNYISACTFIVPFVEEIIWVQNLVRCRNLLTEPQLLH